MHASPHPTSMIDAYSAHANLELGMLMQQLGIDEEFVRAEGSRLWTAGGAEFLDMTASYGALPFGHNPAWLVDAAARFLRESRPSLFKGNPNFTEARAAEALCAAFGARKAIFTSGGAETVNVAIKAARLMTGRRKIVSFWNSFHGTSGDALRATGNRKFREAFPTSLDDRYLLCDLNDRASVEAAFSQGHDIAAVIVEPVQGEGGVVSATPEFLAGLRAICSREGALLIADEIQTGLGRTGHLSRLKSHGVSPDLLLLSKGLSGGLAAAGCCLFVSGWDRSLGLLHSSTFGGNAFATSLVPLVLKALDAPLLEGVRAKGARLHAGLSRLAAQYPELVREARGDGLLCGLELRAEVQTRSRFLRELLRLFGLLPAAVAYARHERHVCFATTLNTHHTLRVTPALTVAEGDIDRAVEALGDFLAAFREGVAAKVVRWLTEKTVRVAPSELKQAHLADWRERAPRVRRGRPAVAFLVHPNSAGYLERFDPSFCMLAPERMERLARNLTGVIEPVRWHDFRVRSLDVHILASPFLPTMISEIGRKVWIEEVELMARQARDLGARLVGLGGLLSVVTRDGQALPELGIGVTTGNSLTAFAAWEAIVQLAARHYPRGKPAIAMLGGYGNIGRTLSELLLAEGFDVLLFGNPDNPLREQMLERARRELNAGPRRQGEVTVGHDLREHVSGPLMVVTATSNPTFELDPAILEPGSTIVDLAMPPNLKVETAARHRHVSVYRVGRIRPPVEIPGLGLLELSDTIYGCLAETIVLGLERDWSGYSRGPLRAEAVTAIGKRAKALGFTSAYDPVLEGPATGPSDAVAEVARAETREA